MLFLALLEGFLLLLLLLLQGFLSFLQAPLEPALGSIHGMYLSLKFFYCLLETLHLPCPGLLFPNLPTELLLLPFLVLMQLSELTFIAGAHP